MIACAEAKADLQFSCLSAFLCPDKGLCPHSSAGGPASEALLVNSEKILDKNYSPGEALEMSGLITPTAVLVRVYFVICREGA